MALLPDSSVRSSRLCSLTWLLRRAPHGWIDRDDASRVRAAARRLSTARGLSAARTTARSGIHGSGLPSRRTADGWAADGWAADGWTADADGRAALRAQERAAGRAVRGCGLWSLRHHRRGRVGR